jgi:hypothetical protein
VPRPFFPPLSPLRAPHSKPCRCPSILPSERRFSRPNFGRSAAAVHPLGEPPTEPFPHQSRPHLTSLSPSPWCRARAQFPHQSRPRRVAHCPLPRCTADWVSPAADILAWRHPGTPPVPHFRASRAASSTRLGWAARLWPSWPSGQPRVAGRRAERHKPWAECGARHYAAVSIVF